MFRTGFENMRARYLTAQSTRLDGFEKTTMSAIHIYLSVFYNKIVIFYYYDFVVAKRYVQ